MWPSSCHLRDAEPHHQGVHGVHPVQCILRFGKIEERRSKNASRGSVVHYGCADRCRGHRRRSVSHDLNACRSKLTLTSPGDACDGSLSTWKVRFPVDDFDYELILSASSATEEIQWKSEILKLSAALTEAARTRPLEPRRYSFLDLNLRGLPRSEATLPLTRTLSADSLPPPRSRPRQRIAFVRANTSHQAGETLSRSATKLASKSQDRIRLERCISDVCTQDVLPYRGTILASSNFFSRTTSIMRRFTSQAEIVRNSLSLDLGRRGLRADVGSASGNDDEGKGGRVSRDGRGSESKCDSYVEQALKSVTEESVDENKRASDIPALALSLVPRKWSSFPGSLFTAFSLGWRKRSRSRLSTEM